MATKPPKMLTLAEINAADDLRECVIDVPEWGGAVKLRGLTLGEVQDIQKAAMQGDEIDATKVNLLTLAKAMVEPVLDESEMYVLAKRHAGVVLGLVLVVNDLTGAGPGEIEARLAAFRG